MRFNQTPTVQRSSAGDSQIGGNSMTIRLRPFATRALLPTPKAKAALECIGVRSEPGAPWQLLQVLRVTATENDVLDPKRIHEELCHDADVAPPGPLPEVAIAHLAEHFLIGLALRVRQVCQLERDQRTATDHRRP